MAQELLTALTSLRDAAAAADTQAAQAFRNAQDAVAARRRERDQASDDLTQKLVEEGRLRRRLAEDLSPAEIGVLTEQLRLLLIEVRNRRDRLLEAEAAFALAEAARDPAAAAATAAQARRREAEAALAEEAAAAARRSGWRARLAEEPAASLEDRADALVADLDPAAPYPAAKARVEAAIPADLRGFARNRAGREKAQASAAATALADARSRLTAFRQNELGPEVELEIHRAAFAEVEGLLGDVVLRGQDRFDQALGLLATVAATRQPTAAEQAAIAAAAVAGGPAATREGVRDQAAADLADLVAQLEARRLEVRAGNIDADVESDAIVIALKGQVVDQEVLLGDAETAFTEADRKALDTWEAAVPDPVWDGLRRFDRAAELVQELRNLALDSLEMTLDTREQALANALLAADKSRRALMYLSGEVAGRRPAAEVAAAFLDRREAAALRGDRF